MPNPVMPASIPMPVPGSWKEQRQKNATEFQVEVGDAKVRRRSTVAYSTVSLEWRLTRAQEQALDDFYEQTLAGGTLKFDWLHPIRGVMATFRFQEAPDRQDLAGVAWQVSAKLIRLA